ncbi:MAG: hypothetical protein J6X70_05735 [Muribaculaceae bacterium]|nr:hypothetical protein [Muribaculaceae bacterium]
MRNDCVVIPQWGAIIAQQEEPRFENGRVTPARRYFTFNAQVDHNDGLIASSLMRRHGITYDQAMREVSAHVAEMRRQVKECGAFPLGRLGAFSLEGKHLVFTPFPSQRALSDSYGLSTIVFKSLAQLEREQQAIAAFTARTEEEKHQQRRNTFVHKSLRWAASIALLVCLGVVLTTHIPIADNVQKASLAFPAITALAPAAVQAEEPVVAAPRFSEGMPDEADGHYILVVATTRNPQEAADFQAVASVKTVTATDGKMNYVYVAQSDDYAALVNAMKRLPAPLRQAYITEAL